MFVGVSGAEYGWLVEGLTCYLEADWEAFRCEAAGHRYGGHAGEVVGAGETRDAGCGHGVHRVEARRWVGHGGGCHYIDLPQHIGELTLEHIADALRLHIVTSPRTARPS